MAPEQLKTSELPVVKISLEDIIPGGKVVGEEISEVLAEKLAIWAQEEKGWKPTLKKGNQMYEESKKVGKYREMKMVLQFTPIKF